VVPGPTDLQGTVARGRGKRGSRFLFPPGEAFSGMPGLSGRGHRPCHGAALGSGPAGAQSPRPAPDPPTAGASRPPGRALAFRGAWTDRSTGNRRARAGETRVAFPVPARRGVLRDARSLWHGPSPLPRRCAGIRTDRGPKPPASARPATGGRFSPAGSGAGLLWCLDLPVYKAPSRAGGETRVAFPDPARTGVLADVRSLWQGPLPLPQRHADPWPPASTRRVGRWPSAVPEPAGLQGTVARGRGERAAFPDPVRRENPFPRIGKCFPAAPAAGTS